MKLSKLIEKLQSLKDEHGDIPVLLYDGLIAEFLGDITPKKTETFSVFDGETCPSDFDGGSVIGDFILLNGNLYD